MNIPYRSVFAALFSLFIESHIIIYFVVILFDNRVRLPPRTKHKMIGPHLAPPHTPFFHFS